MFIVCIRFKVIFGHLQLDNQLPLTLMPVLLAPDGTSSVQNPAFKMTVTMRNENADGIQVYPYVYIRVMLCKQLVSYANIILVMVFFIFVC